MTFLITTEVMYERGNRTHLLQHVHVVRADDKDRAKEHIEAWLDESWPTPAYFGHGYEVHELPGVVVEGDDVAFEYAVSESPITLAPRNDRS